MPVLNFYFLEAETLVNRVFDSFHESLYP